MKILKKEKKSAVEIFFIVGYCVLYPSAGIVGDHIAFLTMPVIAVPSTPEGQIRIESPMTF